MILCADRVQVTVAIDRIGAAIGAVADVRLAVSQRARVRPLHCNLLCMCTAVAAQRASSGPACALTTESVCLRPRVGHSADSYERGSDSLAHMGGQPRGASEAYNHCIEHETLRVAVLGTVFTALRARDAAATAADAAGVGVDGGGGSEGFTMPAELVEVSRHAASAKILPLCLNVTSPQVVLQVFGVQAETFVERCERAGRRLDGADMRDPFAPGRGKFEFAKVSRQLQDLAATLA